MSDSFSGVRQAHRICAAYYQQLLPVLNETAQKLETTFVCWENWSYEKLTARKNPLDTYSTWKWAFIPAMDISFVFSHQQEPGTPPAGKDFVLDFRLITDSELSVDYGFKDQEEEPVATELTVSAENAKSYLHVYLFSCATESNAYDSPKEMWNNYDGYPQMDSQVHLSDKGKIKAIGFYLELKEMARDDACHLLTEKINAHLTKLSAHKAKK